VARIGTSRDAIAVPAATGERTAVRQALRPTDGTSILRYEPTTTAGNSAVNTDASVLRGAAGLALLAASLAAGCDSAPSSPVATSPPRPQPAAATQLALAILDLPRLADSAALLRGEWAERTAGALAVSRVEAAEEAPAALAAADVAIFPPHRLGALVAQGRLRPVRQSVRDDPAYAWNDLFGACEEETAVGGAVYALPLGSPPLMLVARADWMAQENLQAPWAWSRLEEALARQPADRRFLVPDDELAPALALLARSAAWVWSSRRPEALFDADAMTPRIADAPYVAALERLQAVATLVPADPGGGPSWAAAVARLRRGAGLATCGWPGVDRDEPPAENPHAVRCLALPGDGRAFDFGSRAWEQAGVEGPPQILGAAGAMAGVLQGSRNAVAAFQLAAWLTSGERAVQLSTAGSETTWFRASQRVDRSRWIGPVPDPDAAAAMERILVEQPVWRLPRIPGQRRYLALLSRGVTAVVRGDASPAESLRHVAEQWDELTDALGRSAQRSAYRRDLGLESAGSVR